MSADAYLAARAALIATREEVKLVGQLILRAGGGLTTRPTMFAFANTVIGLPEEASLSPDSIIIDGNEWPTAEKIMALLATLHRQTEEMLRIWAALPADIRSHLREPSDLTPRR